jgi:hypothetical protein
MSRRFDSSTAQIVFDGCSQGACILPKADVVRICIIDTSRRCHHSTSQELSMLHESGSLDGFGLYMFGIVLKEMKIVRYGASLSTEH